MANLQQNASDRLATAARLLGAVGSISAPVVAPTAAELLANVIPNQRVERVAKQLERLELAIKTLAHDLDAVEATVNSGEGRALIEDGLVQTANETDEETRVRIGTVLARSLTDNELDLYKAKKILRLLNELLHPEVIWLIYYAFRSTERTNPRNYGLYLPSIDEFESHHGNILKGDSYTLIGPQDDIDREALQRSYKTTLARLDLIQECEKNGERNYQLTELGYLVVRYVLPPTSDQKP